MVEVGLEVLLSVGLPMLIVAAFATIGFFLKKEGAQGIVATAKVPRGPSKSSQKIYDGKNKRVVVVAIAKEPGSLKLRSGADACNYGSRSKSNEDGNNNGAIHVARILLGHLQGSCCYYR